METGNLTPKSNNCIKACRFSGNFGQPDGFGSVLNVRVNRNGDVALQLNYRSDIDGQEKLWTVMLDNEQRKKLIEIISMGEDEPRKFEEYKD